jgi:nitroimidazol reductase NimA-like FMN-containing flavoprotein (pyridoxamine 5'-phosphate oxidase superfamily)
VLSRTERTTLRRRAGRGADAVVFDDVLAACLTGVVSVVVDDAPRALPTTFVRVGDEVFVHGAAKNGLLTAAIGRPVCFTAFVVDGLVFAKSAAHHSMNYRCVVAFGEGRRVDDLAEKARVLAALLEKMRPGRSAEARAPTDAELAATTVVALSLNEASAKQRAGPPVDDEADQGFPTWAGVAPVVMQTGPVEGTTAEP